MAYTKHNWKERLGTKLNRFKDLITGKHLELVNDPEDVTQEGTPIQAQWLNEMEQGIEDAHTTADGLVNGSIRAGNASRLNGRSVAWVPAKNCIPMWWEAGYDGGIELFAEHFVENYTRLEHKYAALKHTHNQDDILQIMASRNVVANPDDANGLISLARTEGVYRYVLSAQWREHNTGQISFPYVPSSPDQQYISFRSKYKDSFTDTGWREWHRLYPTIYGTGAPPAALGPGQIYIQY